ncbi:MAG: M48 family metallopeptidase [Caulobacteraceae bacterium]|nr:M48 family metallopeptidase [Caulobacteraceae bacterium]
MTLFRPQRYADGDLVEVAGGRVRLRVSLRARRVSLRLDTTRGEVIATAPSVRRLAEAVAFAVERTTWVSAQTARLPAGQPIRPGLMIEVLGRPHRLEQGSGRARWRTPAAGAPGALVVPGEGQAYARGVLRALKAEAVRVLTERTRVHAEAVARPMPTVAVMDAKARWGSCKPPRRAGFGAAVEVGRIRYSWRLVLAPEAVLDYVAAHECAHLVEANHSPRFWAVVAGLVGDPSRHRAWLREHGPRLHAFGRE